MRFPYTQCLYCELCGDNKDVGALPKNLSMALPAIHLKEHQNIQNDIEEMNYIIKRSQAQHLAAGVRQSLKVLGATIDRNATCIKRHTGTRQWFVQGSGLYHVTAARQLFPLVRRLRRQVHKLLCSTAILHAFRQQWLFPSSAIAFFFFTFADESKQDGSAVLRPSLL